MTPACVKHLGSPANKDQSPDVEINRTANDGPLARAFSDAALWTAKQCGKASMFVLAGGLIAAWAITGPLFHFSDSWQLVINTGTTIVTFLMGFLIQNTQNRDVAALGLKLDDLIRVSEKARDAMLALEGMTEGELIAVRRIVGKIAEQSAE